MLRIGGRIHATGAIPVIQRVVERVLSFHHLFTGKSKWKIRVVNELKDKALPSAFSCSNSKFRTYNSRKPTLDNMREHWRISNGPP